jgi:tetratricopeptide (TPR) repeat protein
VSTPADITALRYVLERDPASPLFYQLALACSEEGLWEEAERVARSGLAFHPEHLQARLLLGLSLTRLSRPDEARRELEAVSGALGVLASRLYPVLAALGEETGEPGRALEWLRLAEAYGPLPPVESERRQRLEARLREERRRRVLEEAAGLTRQGQAEAAAGLLREALGEAPGDVALQERLTEAEEQVARSREADQVIGVLQGWLHNIRDAERN